MSKHLELSPDFLKLFSGVVYTTSKSGKITYLSQNFEKITGWKSNEWLGKHFSGLVHPADLSTAVKKFLNTMRGKSNDTFELRIKAKNGEYLVASIKNSPLRKKGKIVGQIGLAQDITNSKEEEKQKLHYTNLVESADSAIMARDLKGKITSWNKSAEKLFGFSEEEALGKSFSIIVPKEEIEGLKAIESKVKKGKYVEDYEAIRIRKDGKRIHIIAKVSPIKDSTGKIVGISAFDRDNEQKYKREEQEKFAENVIRLLSSSLDYRQTLKKLAGILVPALADWSSVHIINEEGDIVQLAVAHKDPKKVEWVLSLQKKFAHVRNENAGVYKVVRTGEPDFVPEISKQMLDEAILDPKLRRLVDKLRLESAMTVPLKSGKKILGCLSFVSSNPSNHYDKTDLKFAQELGRIAGQAIDNARLYHEAQDEIKKRKRIEDELRKSRDQLNVTLKNIADGITVQDSKGSLVYVNDEAARASGYSSSKKMLKDPGRWTNLFELRDEYGDIFPIEKLPGRRALAGEKDAQELILFINKLTGQQRWAMVKAKPVFDLNGKVEQVVNIISDITERLELERRKDDFISIASHELNTPVTSIKGYIHLTKQRVKDKDSRAAEFLEKTDRQLNNLVDLIQDLLDLSRTSEGLKYEVRKFDIGELLKEVTEDAKRSAAGHKIIYYDGIHESVKGDKGRLRQVFNNIISNAVKYSPDSKNVIVRLSKDDENIKVSVKDFGIGLEKEETKKIFDRFYRVKDVKGNTFPGLGIGLYLSKEIIKKHNGNIWVESRKDKGSTFHVTIPKVN